MYLHLLIAGSVNSNYTLHIWFTLLFRIPFLVRELNANQIYYLHVPAEKNLRGNLKRNLDIYLENWRAMFTFTSC